jgi:hypothetical protein
MTVVNEVDMVSMHIDRTTGLVTHTGTGEMSIDEIKTAFEARLENPDFRPGMRVLWDCRKATISALSTGGIQGLIAFNIRHADARGEGMSAIVVSKDVDFGVGRMFEAHAQDLPWQTKIFRDLESATQWLSGPE